MLDVLISFVIIKNIVIIFTIKILELDFYITIKIIHS